VYRPLIPCEPTLFPTDCFDYFKPGCRCHNLSAPPIDSGVNATCSRPIFHPSHFASYWEESAPTCRRPIFHEPHWQCHRESH
jgi:hypothetical protein